ncbi:hypothetical protein CDAR_436541 [Caerostris darwini]|uniref:Uncharacterized protein n=1 Tax=Caerostris darwini TaxID=1538125 RepID=A0AAV4SFV4_9ARAC|nr:hypothetical protein CDAR_436541 [Caerostris darwini]
MVIRISIVERKRPWSEAYQGGKRSNCSKYWSIEIQSGFRIKKSRNLSYRTGNSYLVSPPKNFADLFSKNTYFRDVEARGKVVAIIPQQQFVGCGR